jgi:hypothetical protein
MPGLTLAEFTVMESSDPTGATPINQLPQDQHQRDFLARKLESSILDVKIILLSAAVFCSHEPT